MSALAAAAMGACDAHRTTKRVNAKKKELDNYLQPLKL